MRPLSTRELLDAWERGQAKPPVQRSLTLLAAACPEIPAEDLAHESIGWRDARLLTLREWTFGPHLVSLASCPACGERLEMAFEVADVRASEPGEDATEPLSLAASGCELTFRLPNSLDLAALAAGEATGDARRRLLARCLLGARGPDSKEVSLNNLPEATLQAVADRMAEADPQGDVELALSCPACSHTWPAAFDVASFFWTEVDAWARVLLREIHLLAATYHWCEMDILRLSPWRRRAYLELIGG
jgi:hypothetical protein